MIFGLLLDRGFLPVQFEFLLEVKAFVQIDEQVVQF